MVEIADNEEQESTQDAILGVCFCRIFSLFVWVFKGTTHFVQLKDRLYLCSSLFKFACSAFAEHKHTHTHRKPSETTLIPFQSLRFGLVRRRTFPVGSGSMPGLRSHISTGTLATQMRVTIVYTM